MLKYYNTTKRLYIGGFNRIQDQNIPSGLAYLDNLSPTYNKFINVENGTTGTTDYFSGEINSLEFDLVNKENCMWEVYLIIKTHWMLHIQTSH